MFEGFLQRLHVISVQPASPRGMTPEGLARARQLANRQLLSPQTIDQRRSGASQPKSADSVDSDQSHHTAPEAGRSATTQQVSQGLRGVPLDSPSQSR